MYVCQHCGQLVEPEPDTQERLSTGAALELITGYIAFCAFGIALLTQTTWAILLIGTALIVVGFSLMRRIRREQREFYLYLASDESERVVPLADQPLPEIGRWAS